RLDGADRRDLLEADLRLPLPAMGQDDRRSERPDPDVLPLPGGEGPDLAEQSRARALPVLRHRLAGQPGPPRPPERDDPEAGPRSPPFLAPERGSLRTSLERIAGADFSSRVGRGRPAAVAGGPSTGVRLDRKGSR